MGHLPGRTLFQLRLVQLSVVGITLLAAVASEAAASSACAPARDSRPLLEAGAKPVATPLSPPKAPGERDYRHQLRPTPAGWPVRDHWCVWIEPGAAEAGTAAAQREQHWLQAVDKALAQWRELVAIEQVADPEQAQVRIWRRRPPLQRLADGRTRASHGRAVLALLTVQRGERWQAEPQVEVLLSPAQAPQPMQATALHELGHAFGIWGHSDQSGDAMAATPGPVPVLQLSGRDRATMRWLLQALPRL